MNDNVKTWVAALRSKEYDQTITALQRIVSDGEERPIGFCCLGVACDVYIKAGNELSVEESALGDRMRFGVCDTAQLPDVVRQWLGLTTAHGQYATNCLSGLNDNGASFDEIADIIENEPKGLFVVESEG